MKRPVRNKGLTRLLILASTFPVALAVGFRLMVTDHLVLRHTLGWTAVALCLLSAILSLVTKREPGSGA